MSCLRELMNMHSDEGIAAFGRTLLILAMEQSRISTHVGCMIGAVAILDVVIVIRPLSIIGIPQLHGGWCDQLWPNYSELSEH